MAESPTPRRWGWIVLSVLFFGCTILAIGRVIIGGMTTPWIANGAVCLEGERHAIGGRRGSDIREVVRAQTAAGHPVVIAERIPANLVGAQLQVLVFDAEQPRMAVFTLHSPTGRGWLELSGLVGRFVSGMRFGGPGTRTESARPLSGTSGRSAPR